MTERAVEWTVSPVIWVGAHLPDAGNAVKGDRWWRRTPSAPETDGEFYFDGTTWSSA